MRRALARKAVSKLARKHAWRGVAASLSAALRSARVGLYTSNGVYASSRAPRATRREELRARGLDEPQDGMPRRRLQSLPHRLDEAARLHPGLALEMETVHERRSPKRLAHDD